MVFGRSTGVVDPALRNIAETYLAIDMVHISYNTSHTSLLLGYCKFAIDRSLNMEYCNYPPPTEPAQEPVRRVHGFYTGVSRLHCMH